MCGKLTVLLCLMSVVCTAAGSESESFNGTVAELELTADRTIHVSNGCTAYVARVTGGGYTITKTGGGVLRFGWIRNPSARLSVKEGTVDFLPPPKPACLADAFLHVDANALESSMVVAENGTNFVTRWADASGGARYADVCRKTVGKWRTEDTIGVPFILKDHQNGLDVLDFGHYQDASITNSYGVSSVKGAAMSFDVACEKVRDVFAVIGYREEIKTVEEEYGCADATPLLSYTSKNGFLPGKLSAGPSLINFWQNATLQTQFGEVYYDDVLKNGTAKASSTESAGAQPVPDGMFYLNVRPAELSSISSVNGCPSEDMTGLDSFARDRNFCFGGQRIGEYIVFSERLSEVDRAAVENYLRAKWFPVHGFRSVKVESGASFIHASSCDGVVSFLDDEADIFVGDGHVEVDALHDAGAWIHLDASNVGSLETSATEDGSAFVSKWTDADNGVHYASNNMKVNKWRSDPENRKPYLVSGVSSHGLPVVDFGYPQNEGLTNSFGVGIGYGAVLSFDEACKSVREIIVVAGDRKDAADILEQQPNLKSLNSASFISGRESGYVQFFRGNFEKGKNPVILNIYNKLTKGIWGYANGIAVDGSMKTGVQYTNSGPSVRLADDGLHLINFRMDSNGCAQGLAHDGNYAYGGVRIGEVMIFESELADGVRTRIAETLMSKWMGKPPQTYSCGTVAVATGSELSFPYSAVSARKLSLGGTLKAVNVCALTIEVGSSLARVDGVLDLSGEGTIAVDVDNVRQAKVNTLVRLVEADSVVGDASGWKVSGSLSERFIVRLCVEADGLYAKLNPRTFTVTIR